MARIRSIKPEFPQSESMGRCSRDARLLFIELWTICDDHGRARAATPLLSSILFPYDKDAPKKIDGWLEELVREHCIERYEVGGNAYLQVLNWKDHQKIDHPSGSRVPCNPLSKPRESSRDVARPPEATREILGEEGTKEGTKEQGGEVADVSVAARVLSERVGNLDIRFQEQLARQIPTVLRPNESLVQCVDRMVEQWDAYNAGRSRLNYPVSSARKFFESGTWHDSKLWPWKDGQTPAVNPDRYRRSA